MKIIKDDCLSTWNTWNSVRFFIEMRSLNELTPPRRKSSVPHFHSFVHNILPMLAVPIHEKPPERSMLFNTNVMTYLATATVRMPPCIRLMKSFNLLNMDKNESGSFTNVLLSKH